MSALDSASDEAPKIPLAHGAVIHVADLSPMDPTQGVYAQISGNGAAQTATVRCKLNEHMNYEHGAGSQVRKSRTRTRQAHDGSFFKHTDITTTNATISAAAVQNGQDMATPYLKPLRIV